MTATVTPTLAVDLFAGPGGWATGLAAAGITDLGFEWDRDACLTRRAAGHAAVRADVTTLDPNRFAHLPGLVMSPPCQTFSAAGGRSGHQVLDRVLAAVGDAWAGTNPADLALSDDLRDWAVLLPAWWARIIRPEFMLLEQVPAVAPVWAATAAHLERAGYSVWSGVLNAADFGVPQTRQRAFLMASRVCEVAPPRASHAEHPEPVLFGEELAPWVSMADALGWGATGRPYPTICHGTGGGGGVDPEMVGGSHARGVLAEERRSGRWILNPGRTFTQPNRRLYDPATEPAPTVAFGHDAANWQWIFTRPATTVMGDPRVWPPGHKINAADRARLGDDEAAARYGDRAGTDAIHLEVHEAAVLQSFPADYPFQGTKTSRFRQVGDAVPPLMALVLGLAVQGIDWPGWLAAHQEVAA